MLIASDISQDEACQVRTIIGALPLNREVIIGHIGDLGNVIPQVLAERSRLIKAHTISQDVSLAVRTAIRQNGHHLKWTYIERDPREFGFRVDALFIDSLSDEDTLRVLSVWVPYMAMGAPVWVHESSVESYPHIRKVGRMGEVLVLPGLSIVMSYYEDGKGIRTQYAKQALESLNEHLDYGGELRLLIADDSELDVGMTVGYLTYDSFLKANRVASEHRGIGAALNRALGHVDAYWMYTTDDWVLNKDLNLDKAVRLLDMYDMVRLGPLHPNLTCKTKFQVGLGWWLEIDQHAGGFAFATRPFVARLEMFNQIGRFVEGVNSYDCERDYAERVTRSNVRIAALLSDGEEWEHIGEYEVGYREVIHA